MSEAKPMWTDAMIFVTGLFIGAGTGFVIASILMKSNGTHRSVKHHTEDHEYDGR